MDRLTCKRSETNHSFGYLVCVVVRFVYIFQARLDLYLGSDFDRSCYVFEADSVRIYFSLMLLFLSLFTVPTVTLRLLTVVAGLHS